MLCHIIPTGLSLPNIGNLSLGSSLNSSLNSTLGGTYTDPLSAAASYSPTIPQQYNGTAAAAAAATFSPSGYMFGVPQMAAGQQLTQQIPQKEGLYVLCCVVQCSHSV